METASVVIGQYKGGDTFQTNQGKIRKELNGLSPKINKWYYILIVDGEICNLTDYGR